MPIYVYECSDCKTEHKELQSFSDKPLETCPNCKSRNFKKKVSREVSVQWKTSGKTRRG